MAKPASGVSTQTTFPDPQEHAYVILLAVEGDYQIALDCMELYRQEYGERYARRLAAFLRPAGRLLTKLPCDCTKTGH